METPLQAARRKRGWSQSRLAWELSRLAERKGIGIATPASLKTQISRWENGHITPDFYQPLLRELYKATPSELGFGYESLPEHASKSAGTANELLSKARYTRDDLDLLSQNFDDALARSSVEEISRLAHE